MATEEDIVLRVKAENSEALKNLAEQKVLVDQLRNSNKGLEAENKTLQKSMEDLSKAGKSNTDEYKALSKQLQDNKVSIAANNEAVKAANKEITNQSRTIQNNIKFQKENTDSIQAMRAQLSLMKQEYYAMSKAERESADGGVALQKSIKSLNDDISKAEQSIGVFGRNVGNYEGAINSAIGLNKGFIGTLVNMANTAKATGASLATVLVGGIKAVGAALKALLNNPLVLIIAAVVVAIKGLISIFTGLSKIIKGNEEQSRQLAVALAPLHRMMEALKSVLQGVAQVLVNVMGLLSKMAGGVAKALEKIPFVGKYIKQANEATEAAIQLEKDKQALQDAERQNQLDQAKTEEKVSELRAKIAQKDKYSAEERIRMSNEVADAERKQAEENIRIAEEKLRIAKIEASYNKNSKETNEKLIQLEADVINQRTRMNNQIRSLERNRQTAISQIAAEQKAADDERLKREQAYQKTVEDGRKKIRNLTLELMADGQDKEIALRKKQLDDELANIQGTEKQKAQIRALLEEQYNRDIAAIREKYSQDALDKEVDRKAKELEIMLELARGNADKELEIKLQQLDMEKQAAIQAAEESGVSIELVEQQFAQRKADLEAEADESRKTAQAERLQEYMDGLTERYAQELEMYADNEQQKADLQLQIEQDKLNALLTLSEEQKAEMFASEEAYQQAVRAQIKQTDKANEESTKQAKAARVAALQDAQAKMDSLNSIAGSITDIFNQIAGDNEEMQGFLKAVALFQIGVDMAKAIAGAISGAMTQPFPANIAAVVSGIAAVTAGIVQAKQTLSKQKEATTPKFATGGLVEGAGTGTSDSISARLSNGESVINARSTAMFAPLLSSINQAGGGVPIQMESTATQAMGSDYMAESIAQAMRQMPNPVVSVAEITDVNNRVSVLETLRNR